MTADKDVLSLFVEQEPNPSFASLHFPSPTPPWHGLSVSVFGDPSSVYLTHQQRQGRSGQVPPADCSTDTVAV